MDDRLHEMIINQLRVLNDRQESLHNKVNGLFIGQGRIDENLKEHMRRTELAEAALGALKKALAPVETHVSHVEGGLKLLGLLSILTGTAAALWQIFGG